MLHFHMVDSFHVSFQVLQFPRFKATSSLMVLSATGPQHIHSTVEGPVEGPAGCRCLALRSAGSPVDLQHPGPLSEDATDQRCHRCLCPSLFAHRGRFSAAGWQPRESWDDPGFQYPLVICYIAIENGHRNSGFSH